MATTTVIEFLPLEYTRIHYGSPIEAQSEIIRHSWCDHDHTDIRAEFTIEAGREESVNDYDVFNVWVKETVNYEFPADAQSVTWWESPDFNRFEDAEAYCQFAYQRWQATGRLASAAMEPRHDLDSRRNPC